jgi:hypothetical protein
MAVIRMFDFHAINLYYKKIKRLQSAVIIGEKNTRSLIILQKY